MIGRPYVTPPIAWWLVGLTRVLSELQRKQLLLRPELSRQGRMNGAATIPVRLQLEQAIGAVAVIIPVGMAEAPSSCWGETG